MTSLARPHKYGAKRCDRHQPAHASLRECRRFTELELMQRAGEIRGLRQQVVYELAPPVVLDGRKKPALRYVADFVYDQLIDAHDPPGGVAPGHVVKVGSGWRSVVEDATGQMTRVKRIKQHLMKSVWGIEVVLT